MECHTLAETAKRLRHETIKVIYEAKDSHPDPVLSIADIVTVLYFEEMRANPSNPRWEDRDRLILSKGHACPILYAVLSEKKYFGNPVGHFNLRSLGSIFQDIP